MSRSFSKQLPINLISNIAVFLVGIIISLFLTPFYIKNIGIDGLGLVKLALILPAYTGLVSLVISGSVGRFLTIDLNKGDINNANGTLNTAFFSITVILLFLVPLIFFVSSNIQYFFDIPIGFEEQSIELFMGVLLASVLALFSGLFMIPAYANNRLDISNFAKLITTLVQSGLIIIFLMYVSIDLSLVGYAYFIASLVGLVVSMFVWRKLTPQLSINYKFFQIKKLKEMTSMGSWLMINSIGAIFFLSIDLILINVYFGSAETGEYSISLQWGGLLRTLAAVIAGVLGPMIVISYAKNHMEKIIKISTVSVKMMGLLMAIPVGIIAGLSAPLLTLWLGESFAYLSPLMWLMILPLTINLAILPLFNVQVAMNKVKIPGLFSLFAGVMNLLLAIIFIKAFDIGIYSVALASAIMLIVKNFLFTPIYTSHLLGLEKSFFIKRTIPGFLLSSVIFFMLYMLQNWIPFNTWFTFIGISIMTLLLSLLVVWFLALNSEEKEWIQQIVKLKQNKV